MRQTKYYSKTSRTETAKSIFHLIMCTFSKTLEVHWLTLRVAKNKVNRITTMIHLQTSSKMSQEIAPLPREWTHSLMSMNLSMECPTRTR